MAKNSPQDLENREYFSRRLNLLMEQKGIRQIDLHNSLDIPKSTITGYVKGKSLPTAGNLQKLADFLNVKKSFLDLRFIDTVSTSTLKELLDNNQSEKVFEMFFNKIKEILSFEKDYMNMEYIQGKLAFNQGVFGRVLQSSIINPGIVEIFNGLDLSDSSKTNEALLVSKQREAREYAKNNVLTLITNEYISRLINVIEREQVYSSTYVHSEISNLINSLNNKIDSYGGVLFEINEIIEKIGVQDRKILGYCLQRKISTMQIEINNLVHNDTINNFAITKNNIYTEKSDVIDTIEFDYYKGIQNRLNDLVKEIGEHFSD
ncbi:TPA: helix-turn-helix transcriptional regulator [Streptococcus pyogenes]|nr:helix-turn-helix transcriptional regulator [Streptococcus pyogenes]HER5558462.1 helix-turn-helix transcriptional regulator [Streptococcus pyogenes]HER5560042.1 helix-turn-helix transcriptional regulator [Streptococcus pyogenes]